MRVSLTGLLLIVGGVSLSSAEEPAVTFTRRAAQVGDVRSETLVIESRSSTGAQIASWTLVRRVKILAASDGGAITDARVDHPRSSVWVNFCLFGFPADELKGSYRYTRDVDTFRVRRVGAPRGQDGLTTFSRIVLRQHARDLQGGAGTRFASAVPNGKPLRIGATISCGQQVVPRLLDTYERTPGQHFHPFLMTFDRQTLTLRRTANLAGARCGVFDVTLATPVGRTIDGLGEASAALKGRAWIEVGTGRLRRLLADGPVRYRRIDRMKRPPFKPSGTVHVRYAVDYSSPRK